MFEDHIGWGEGKEGEDDNRELLQLDFGFDREVPAQLGCLVFTFGWECAKYVYNYFNLKLIERDSL